MSFQAVISTSILFCFLLICISCNKVEKKASAPIEHEVVESECTMRLNPNADTIRYQQQKIDKSMGGYAVSFEFPLMVNYSGIINTVIQMELYDSLTNAENFLNGNYIAYKDTMENYSFKNRFRWRDEESIQVVFNSTTIMSLMHDDYSWRTGGAIGTGRTSGLNYDLTTGKKIELEDIIKSNSEALLEEKILKVYNQKYEKVESIVLKQNFLIEEEGIVFIYNRFEDVPFALGLRLLVSYCELEDILIEGSTLEKFLKRSM